MNYTNNFNKKTSAVINIDRFNGEATEPKIWGHCENCGLPIHVGHKFYMHNDLYICTECSERYAVNKFKEEAKVMYASNF
jgi:hypothetical protein